MLGVAHGSPLDGELVEDEFFVVVAADLLATFRTFSDGFLHGGGCPGGGFDFAGSRSLAWKNFFMCPREFTVKVDELSVEGQGGETDDVPFPDAPRQGWSQARDETWLMDMSIFSTRVSSKFLLVRASHRRR